MWYRKQLHEIKTMEWYAILKLRIDTFVVEQQRIYHEVDEHDLEATHIFHKNEAGEIDAYARLFQDKQRWAFGRVVTASSARGKGLGIALVKEIIDECQRLAPQQVIEIEAQEQVVSFYEKLGFKTEGEMFIFESTPHVKMVYQQSL